MYEHSRALYRALKPMLIADSVSPHRPPRRLLAIVEDSLERMAEDARMFPTPADHLFARARSLFGAQDQLRALRIIERHVGVATASFVARRREHGPNLRRCAALNRRGEPCQREPLRGGRFCPSHARRMPVPMAAEASPAA